MVGGIFREMMKRAAMMLMVMLMTAATAWATQPDRCLDACTGGSGYIRVQGWAYDPDAPAQSIDVHVYVYTDEGCTNQYGDIHVLTANVSRPDVNEVKNITGDHGFSANIAIADEGSYWVKVFAIDTNGDGDPQIGSTTAVTVTGNGTSPGSLEVCTGGAELIHVEGWAYDPDDQTQSIDVHVYVYTDEDCTNQYGDVHVLTANVSRSDVNDANNITGDHGFSADIAIDDAGNYWVKVFAIDTNGGDGPQIGSTTAVTVTPNYPSWVRGGDTWDKKTKTLTVYADVLAAMAYRGQTEIEHVVIGSSMEKVGMYAFFQCSNLASVTYQEGSKLTHILDGAFAMCTSLTSFSIPAGITYFDGTVFTGCTNLTTIVVDEGNPKYKSEDGLLLTKDGTTLMFCPFNRAAGHCTLPNGISIIDNQAFMMCTTLTDITLPASVTTIKGYAFWNCSNLETVNFAEGSQLETIAAYAFEGCSSLKTFNFAKNTPLTSIWTQAFSGCESLESIALPDHVVEIRERAFEGCTKLTTIHIPASLTTIQRYAFLGCSGLTTFTVDNASTTFASNDGVLTNKEGTGLVCYPIGRKATSYTVPEGMTIIAPYTFQDCTALEYVILPEGLIVIDDYAFDGCTSLKEIIIPSTVESTGSASFRSCTSLEKVLFMSKGYRTLTARDAFDGVSSECHFYVRSASYRTKEEFSPYNDRMTVISAVGTTYGAIATPSGEPFITYGGTDYYVAGSTFAISRGAAPDVSTGYVEPFLSYVVRDDSDSDISEAVLSGETLTLPESDVTVMARYTPIVYNITYDLNGGTANPAIPTTFTVESGNITLTTPERFGSIFTGWTGTGLEEAAMSVSIPKGSTGSREYTATWVYPTYVDADGIERECTVAKRISNPGVSPVFDDESVEEAWYYFDGVELFYGTFTFKAKKTHIILFDDSYLLIEAQNFGIVANDLSIYGQGQSTGILFARLPQDYDHTFTGVSVENLTINGGNLYSYGFWDYDDPNSDGYSVYATADITVNGGFLLASGGKGMYAAGDITLGWRLPTDMIAVDIYLFGGDLSVKPGQYFTSVRNDIITGTLTEGASSLQYYNLEPCCMLTLSEGISAIGKNAITHDGLTYVRPGDAVTIEGTPDVPSGYVFGDYMVTNDGTGEEVTDAVLNDSTLTMPTYDVAVRARWITNASVTFTNEGYGTYYNSSEDVVLPTGMKARIVTAKADDGTLTYETVADGDHSVIATSVVPARTAVMLQVAAANAQQTIGLTLTSSADTRDFTDNNLLHGSDVDTTTTGPGAGDYSFYKLSYNRDGDDKTIGWYWGADNAGEFQSGAHKAWLALPKNGQQAPPRSIGLPGFNESTTAVDIIPYHPQKQDDAWYDMYGRKLDAAPTTDGLYIRGGQKIMIK